MIRGSITIHPIGCFMVVDEIHVIGVAATITCCPKNTYFAVVVYHDCLYCGDEQCGQHQNGEGERKDFLHHFPFPFYDVSLVVFGRRSERISVWFVCDHGACWSARTGCTGTDTGGRVCGWFRHIPCALAVIHRSGYGMSVPRTAVCRQRGGGVRSYAISHSPRFHSQKERSGHCEKTFYFLFVLSIPGGM